MDIKSSRFALTPVQFDQDIFWKRDDYYQPFGPYHVNGGKVRQAFALFDDIFDDLCNGKYQGVITAASVYSPQSANIAAVARCHNVNCIACVGGTTEARLDELDMMRLTKHYGSAIRIVAGHGMSPVIHARMHELASQNHYLPIEMGELMVKNPNSIFELTATQVANLPSELDNLIIPTGVAIQMAGILIGLKRYDKKVKNIYSICVGPTREKQIAKYFETVYNDDVTRYNPFQMIAHKAPYTKGYDFKVNGEYIDDLYEGKAVDWLMKNIDYKNESTLVWLVGKRPRKEDVDFIIENNL